MRGYAARGEPQRPAPYPLTCRLRRHPLPPGEERGSGGAGALLPGGRRWLRSGRMRGYAARRLSPSGRHRNPSPVASGDILSLRERNQALDPARARAAQARDLGRGPAVARAARPAARRLQVPPAGADRRMHRRFRMRRRQARHRGRRAAPRQAGRCGPGATREGRGGGVYRDTLHERRGARAARLGDRGDPPHVGCRSRAGDAGPGVAAGLKGASEAFSRREKVAAERPDEGLRGLPDRPNRRHA